MTEQLNINLLFLIPLFLQLAGMIVSACLDSHIDKKRRLVLLIIAGVASLLIVQELCNYLQNTIWEAHYAKIANSVLGYSLRPVVIVLFLLIVRPERKHIWAWVMTGCNFLVHLTAFFTDICFTFDSTGHFIRGPLGYTSHVVSFAILAILLFLTVRAFAGAHKRDLLIPMVNGALIVAAVVMDSVVYFDGWAYSFLVVTLVSVCVFYYVWLHLQFVHQHEQAMLERQRLKLVMSQVQPHFVYNTLAAIQGIAGMPPEAKTAIAEFAAYLRGNMAVLDEESTIPFAKELEHVKTYVALEQFRFGDKVGVQFDIRDDAFELPPLTVQILVENAIKHGITQRYEGGTVKVATWHDEGTHMIRVADNGVGFDVLLVEEEKRIGLRAVKTRIEHIGGSVQVESTPGVGTTVTIAIPDSAPKMRGGGGIIGA